MLFSVIYEANYPVPRNKNHDTSIEDVAPPKRRSLWDLTEAHDEDAYWGSGERWRHRKWAALLTREQFDEFIRKTWVTAEDTETMGSIGAPGFGFGWAPAISFNYFGDGQLLNAYVTPVPEVRGKARPDLINDRLMAAVRRQYGERWEEIVFAKEAA